MPFKDIASTDTLFMRELPAQDDKAARTALRRLQEVGMHVIAPVDHLRENPLEDAIALVDLADAQNVQLPAECKRCACLTPKFEHFWAGNVLFSHVPGGGAMVSSQSHCLVLLLR
jgi:hypothetical protein